MLENWKTVNGYEGFYEVSDLGRVRSLKRCGKIVSQVYSNGYLKVTLHKLGKRKMVSVHRVVAETFIPNLKGKETVNHIDGNKHNNAVSNLEWATQKENIDHSISHGLKLLGEQAYQHKLTWEDVRYIRNNFKKNDRLYGLSALGKKFGVRPSTINKVVVGITWKE